MVTSESNIVIEIDQFPTLNERGGSRFSITRDIETVSVPLDAAGLGAWVAAGAVVEAGAAAWVDVTAEGAAVVGAGAGVCAGAQLVTTSMAKRTASVQSNPWFLLSPGECICFLLVTVV